MLDLITSDKAGTMLRIEQIETDGGTQMRAGLNDETVASYVEDMDGYGGWGRFPPVDVFYDGTKYWLANGFHRIKSYSAYCRDVANILDLRDRKPVPAIVHSGTRRDAVLFAVGANNDHGLRRSNEDKRRSVTNLLNDNEWSQWSNREIARRCNVSEAFVRIVRGELTAHGAQLDAPERRYVDKHGNERTMKTAKIGATKPSRQPTPPPRTVANPVAPTVTYIDCDDSGDPTVDAKTVHQVRAELAADIDSLVARLASALSDVEAARRLTEAQGDSDRAAAGIRALMGKLRGLKMRGL